MDSESNLRSLDSGRYSDRFSRPSGNCPPTCPFSATRSAPSLFRLACCIVRPIRCNRSFLIPRG